MAVFKKTREDRGLNYSAARLPGKDPQKTARPFGDQLPVRAASFSFPTVRNRSARSSVIRIAIGKANARNQSHRKRTRSAKPLPLSPVARPLPACPTGGPAKGKAQPGPAPHQPRTIGVWHWPCWRESAPRMLPSTTSECCPARHSTPTPPMSHGTTLAPGALVSTSETAPGTSHFAPHNTATAPALHRRPKTFPNPVREQRRRAMGPPAGRGSPLGTPSRRRLREALRAPHDHPSTTTTERHQHDPEAPDHDGRPEHRHEHERRT